MQSAEGELVKDWLDPYEATVKQEITPFIPGQGRVTSVSVSSHGESMQIILDICCVPDSGQVLCVFSLICWAGCEV